MDDSRKRWMLILCLTGAVLGCGGYYVFSGETEGGPSRTKNAVSASPRVVSAKIPAPNPKIRPVRRHVQGKPAVASGGRRFIKRGGTRPNDGRRINRRKPIRVRKKPVVPVG